MKLKVLGIILVFLYASLTTQAQNNLTIQVSNIEMLKGELFIRLGTDTTMLKNEDVDNQIIARKVVTDSVMLIRFNHLKDGFYAFAVFQDLNANEKLDRKKFGIPAEPFAFSRDALGKFGPPKFEEAGFEINGGGNYIQQVNLIYRKPKRKE